MIGRALRHLAAGAGVLALAACAVGPNFHRPALKGTEGYGVTPAPAEAGPDTQAVALGADLPGQWWEMFHVQALDDLMAKAIKANADLDAARAALRAAKAEVRAQQAGFWPTADLSGQASREKDSAALSPTLNVNTQTFQAPPLFSLYTAQLAITYSPDVFGGVRRSVENAKAQAEQQRFELEASYLTLTSNLANAVIQAASLKAQLEADERLVAIARRTLEVYRQEKALGQLAQSDVEAEVQLLAQAEGALAPLRRQLAQARDQIAALCGATPAELHAPDVTFDAIATPAQLPLSLPSKLVDQRPDIRAAEANLHAASAAVGVAIAARLPSITLGATGGGASPSIGSVLSNGNSFWTLAGGFAQPVFEGGQLLAKQRAAEAAYDQARAQYRSTVIDAFQNVADSLHALDADAQALAAAVRADESAERALTIAQGQARLGQIAGVQSLVAEQTYLAARLARIQARTAQLQDTTALFQAVGGAWWNRKDS
jgi:NodT family efflux transporter outer membrane factor (OMF) lipoprotein